MAEARKNACDRGRDSIELNVTNDEIPKPI